MKASKEQMEKFGHKILLSDVCECGATVFEPVKLCPRLNACACTIGLECSTDLTKKELERYEGSREI